MGCDSSLSRNPKGGTMEGHVANVGMRVSRMLSPAAPFSLYTRADFEEAGDCALHSPFSLLGNVDSGSLPENWPHLWWQWEERSNYQCQQLVLSVLLSAAILPCTVVGQCCCHSCLILVVWVWEHLCFRYFLVVHVVLVYPDITTLPVVCTRGAFNVFCHGGGRKRSERNLIIDL